MNETRPAPPRPHPESEPPVDPRRLPALIRHLEECFETLGHKEVFLNRKDWDAIKANLQAAAETTEAQPDCPLPASDRNTILDAMSYPREYLARWKGKGNSGNAQYTLDRLQRMLERTAVKTPSEDPT